MVHHGDVEERDQFVRFLTNDTELKTAFKLVADEEVLRVEIK